MIVQREARNLLLARLAKEDFAQIQPFLARVHYDVDRVVAAPGDPIDTICFPEGGITALLSVMADGSRVAVGLIGNEGVVGAPLLHGADRWHWEVVVRAQSSTALVIPADQLLAAFHAAPGLQELLLRYSGSFTRQVSCTSVANMVGTLDRRMARWILLYHDRLPGDEIVMTHQEIGIMLGVRRASATDVLHVLEGVGAIRNARGRITVRDRARLEDMAGDIYGGAEADYRRLIGPFGKAAAAPAVH